VGSEAAAERVEASISEWIERRLRLRVNRAKSGRGRPWERQFLGFAIDREGRIELAERSLQRYKRKVRELWRGAPGVDEHAVAGSLAKLAGRLVGLLPTGRKPPAAAVAGRLDAATYPQVFLVKSP
jgi:hypothetical protein